MGLTYPSKTDPLMGMGTCFALSEAVGLGFWTGLGQKPILFPGGDRIAGRFPGPVSNTAHKYVKEHNRPY